MFRHGDFTLHSGERSPFLIDCATLTDDDLAALAAWVAPALSPFREVVGIPHGGLAFARHLTPYARSQGPRLLVDDVLTTGHSLEDARSRASDMGVVIFARRKPPWWVFAIFQVGEWVSPDDQQATLIEARLLAPHFVPTTTGLRWRGKVRCAYCKRTGWPGSVETNPSWWGRRHGANCANYPAP